MPSYEVLRDARPKSEIKKGGRASDCAVIAVSLVTGVSYADALDLLASEGRQPGKGTYRHQIFAVIQSRGFEVVKTQDPKLLNHKTVRGLNYGLEKGDADGKVLLVFVSRHVLAVVNNKVEDWSETKCKRIKEIFEIRKK